MPRVQPRLVILVICLGRLVLFRRTAKPKLPAIRTGDRICLAGGLYDPTNGEIGNICQAQSDTSPEHTTRKCVEQSKRHLQLQMPLLNRLYTVMYGVKAMPNASRWASGMALLSRILVSRNTFLHRHCDGV
jgi:hypothetical protein